MANARHRRARGRATSGRPWPDPRKGHERCRARRTRPPCPRSSFPRYDVGDSVATRKAYGDALVAVGAADPRVVVLDAEVSNSTHADEFKHSVP